MRRYSRNLLLLLAVAALWGARRQAASLGALHDRQAAVVATAAHRGPPLIAFTTIVLGGFRGLIADMLWMRASRLQDEGRFFELVQLADWITMLEPRATEAWGFHAWNMAYNVSDLMADPEERWRWVRNGIQLIRDQGLRYNPGDVRLYFELGWLFQHKIGASVDSAHGYYKRAWAAGLHDLLGGGMLAGATAADRPALRAALSERYRLDLDRMIALDDRYGPLDWRLPESHALYWAAQGLARSPGQRHYLCDRMLYQCAALSATRGSLRFDPRDGRYERSPNPDLLPKAMRVYEAALRKFDDDGPRVSYRNFLTAAIPLAQAAGMTTEARAMTRRLAELERGGA